MTDFEFKTYPKIPGPFKRFTEGPDKNKLDRTRWSEDAFEVLQNVPWVFSSKVDGTNIRVGWDGYMVQFGGRTDKAQIPPKLQEALEEIFVEELFEQKFGEQPVILYGEGYGGKIQKGGKYRAEESFILFDVRVGHWWLKPEDVQDIAGALGVDVVPQFEMTLNEAIKEVETGWESNWYDGLEEGIVGTPKAGLLNRSGSRIQVKVKTEDFHEE